MNGERVTDVADPTTGSRRGRRIAIITAFGLVLWLVGLEAASRWLSRDGGEPMPGMPGMPGMRMEAPASETPMATGADVVFATSMTIGLEQVRRAAALAEPRTMNPDVRAVAMSFRQGKELGVVRRWLVMWEVPIPRAGRSGAGAEELARLAAASAETGDRLFIDIARGHYLRTLSAARDELAGGRFPPARALARELIEASTGALDRLDMLSVDLGAANA